MDPHEDLVVSARFRWTAGPMLEVVRHSRTPSRSIRTRPPPISWRS